MKRAWIGVVLSATAATAQESRNVEFPLLPGTKATRAQVQFYEADLFPKQFPLIDLVFGADGDRTVDRWRAWLRTSGAAARSNAVALLLDPPDARQIEPLLRVRAANETDSDGGVLRVGDEVLLYRRRGERDDHVRGLTTSEEITDALVLGNDERKLHVLPYAALVGKGSPATVAALVHVLGSTDPELRWRAALGLSWSAGTAAGCEAVPALVERLRDDDEIVRAFAAAALAKIAPATADLDAALAGLLQSGDPVVVSLFSAIRNQLATQRARESRSGSATTSRPASH